jgi:hypothetical protein
MSRERDLFERCLDLPDAAARSRFLACECGSYVALRTGVDRLLELASRPTPVLDEPLAEAFAARLTAAERHPCVPEPDAALWAIDGTSFPIGPALVAGDVGSLGSIRLVHDLPPSAFGPVWSAESPRWLGRGMVRALAPQFAAVSPVRGRFLSRARQLAMVVDEALPAVLAMDEKPIPFVVIADRAGESLADVLTRGECFSLAESARLGAAIAAGLAAAHTAGCVHRALCLANVFLTGERDRPVRLLDVGLARAVTETLVTPADLPGQAAAFLAPEQVLDDRLDPLDHRPDLFALGSVLVALATGGSPFAAATPEATLRRVAEGAPVPGGLDRLHGELRGLVEALLEVEPGRRPPSAEWVADRLARLAAQG